jgi:benzoate/toluate 1,2-dioxygenase reductase subunit
VRSASLVEAVRSDFTGRGVEPTGFYYEKFTPAAHATTQVPVVQDEPVAEPEVVETAAQPEVAETAAQPEPQIEDGPPLTRVQVDGEHPDARSVAGQEMLPPAAIDPLHAAASAAADTDRAATARTLMGQRIARAGSEEEVTALDPAAPQIEAPDARSIAGQLLWPRRDVDPLVERVPEAEPASRPDGATILADGYEIGEEHPSVHESDAVFEARQALELGALELVIGRLSSRQLTGYRLLAEATTRYVDGDRFVDAAGYTETNAAFHDYLFTQTGNDHLLQAYQALGVKGAMEEALRHATWCHPLCAQDHLDIVDAFEAKDRVRARRLISEHADRSKITMRRAMDETIAGKRPAFVTPGRFAGQVVVVTGAAQGIGECAARRIAAEGGLLVLADRSDLVEELASELSADGHRAHAVVADLETWEGASAVVEKAVAQHGRVDVSVHTVGGTIWAKPFADYPPEQIQAEISRSLFPTLWSCRAVVPQMIEQGHGTIVNVSSVATRGLNRVPYAAAKGGVNAITSALALEAAPHGIRVVATAPGGTDAPPRRIPRGPGPESEQEQAWYRTIVDQTVESSLMKRYGTLDEQAAAICFLASKEASYITGTVLPVAGGDLG